MQYRILAAVADSLACSTCSQTDHSTIISQTRSVSNQTNNLKIDISGVADVQADELKSANCIVDISGSGKADVSANKSLDATIFGGGSVKVHGNPATVSKHIAGVGSIEML